MFIPANATIKPSPHFLSLPIINEREMEMIPFSRRQWRRRRGYNRISPATTRNIKVAKLGGGHTATRSWRIRLARKVRLLRLSASPVKIWNKLKNGYINMMLRLAANTGPSGIGLFEARRVPEIRHAPMQYSRSEFEDRLVYEIYKSMVDSFELGYEKKS